MRTTLTRALDHDSSSSSSTTTAQNTQSTQSPGQNGYGPGSGSAPADWPERGRTEQRLVR